jgi:hypothetical protein
VSRSHQTPAVVLHEENLFRHAGVQPAISLNIWVKLWGADHVVIGTDYPYDMGYYKPVDFVENVESLTRARRRTRSAVATPRSCSGSAAPEGLEVRKT